MQDELECEGRIRFGNLPWAISERLAQFSGNWLAYAPEENALITRQGQPTGCPAVAGVPCELISIIDLIPSDQRECMPGGTLHIRDRSGRALNLVVERGEIRVQWPRAAARPGSRVPASAHNLVHDTSGGSCISGWARFAGLRARRDELRSFADRFQGLFPEGELPSECEQNLVYVEFKETAVGERELLELMRDLADPPDSLQAELEVSSRTGPMAKVRIRIHDGAVERVQMSEAC